MTERENELLRADLEVCAADRDQMKAERDGLRRAAAHHRATITFLEGERQRLSGQLALARRIARAGFPHSHPECPTCRGEGTGKAIQTEGGAVFYPACFDCAGKGFIELEKLS